MSSVSIGALAYEFDNVFFAAECLSEVRDRHEVSEIADRLLSRLKELSSVNRLLASPSYGFIYTAAIKAIANSWKGDHEVLSWLKSCALSHEDDDAKFAAILGIGEGWTGHRDVFLWLKHQTLNNEDPIIRFSCLSAVVKEWNNEVDVLTLLKTIAQDDDNSGVRRIALEGLSDGWINETGMIDFFFDRAANDPCEQKETLFSKWISPRRAALIAILQSCPEHPDTRGFLFERALKEPDPSIRCFIIREIVKGWPSFPDLLSWLKTLAETDEDFQVRQTAAEEVVKHWHTESGTLLWLKNWIRIEEHPQVRQALLVELAQYWHDDPKILSWLKEWAHSDPQPGVRVEATKAYVGVANDASEVFEFLRSSAFHDFSQYQDDKNSKPRQTAVELLVEHYSDYPQTLPLLRRIVEEDPDSEFTWFVIQTICTRWGVELNTQWLKTVAQKGSEVQLRVMAMSALVQGWQADPEILSWVKDLAQKSENEHSQDIATHVLESLFNSLCPVAGNIRMTTEEHINLRKKALATIARYYKEVPASLHLFARTARDDPDARIRQFALQELAENWNNVSGMADFLYERSLQDPFTRYDVEENNPRQTALEAFVKYYPDDPRLSQLLHDRKENDPDQTLRKYAHEKYKRQ